MIVMRRYLDNVPPNGDHAICQWQRHYTSSMDIFNLITNSCEPYLIEDIRDMSSCDIIRLFKSKFASLVDQEIDNIQEILDNLEQRTFSKFQRGFQICLEESL